MSESAYADNLSLLSHGAERMFLVTLRTIASSGAVYCNRSRLFVGLWLRL